MKRNKDIVKYENFGGMHQRATKFQKRWVIYFCLKFDYDLEIVSKTMYVIIF